MKILFAILTIAVKLYISYFILSIFCNDAPKKKK